MAGSRPVDDILDFLRRNKFTNAEAALRNELGTKSDINGILQKLKLDDNEPGSQSTQELNGPKLLEQGPKIKGLEESNSAEFSKELIVKEVECGAERQNGYEGKWKSCGIIIGEQSMVDASVGTSDNKNFTFSKSEFKEVDQQKKPSGSCSKNDLVYPSTELWKDTSTSYDEKKEGKMKTENNTIKDEVDEVGRGLYFRKVQGGEPKDFGLLDFNFLGLDNHKEELPRLPPVRLKSADNSFSIQWEEKYERDGPGPKILNADNGYLIGSFLDVPIGREIDASGKTLAGGSWLSVSRGIAEDTSDLVSGFATIGDGMSETIDYPNDYWDSDEYEDDDDVGYMRQPIEDETWFLAHEVDYPSDNEKGTTTGHGSVPDPQDREPNKEDEDDQSFAEEESYLSGEPYFQSKNVDPGLTNEKVISESNDDQHGSVRSIGVGIHSDAADIGSEVRESLVGGSSEGDIEYFIDHNLDKNDKNRMKRRNPAKYVTGGDKGFSFPPPRNGQLAQTSSGKSLWSNKERNVVGGEGNDDDDVTTSWRRKSSESSPVDGESGNSSPSSLSNYGYIERECVKKDEDVKAVGVREEDPRGVLEDEEAAAVQEQVKQIKAQEEEFETFNLKIVHRKNRHVQLTGFEEDKNFHVVLNSVIAGRYHVTEYLGSAAFSKAIQAHDLHTGMDVCVKIIKNNKDFFDQSLDEIKLLKYVNKHDPADKYHLLRLYDYFYYREHLLIVCELLKANLYEFHKFNRESGGEVYFTMPRLQSITIQCLEALQFLHSLGLIHCDLKPENILVKSYSRCEVKVIDLGSSCFETDHLCSYVQSRSYRAPEVLFQNDSPATLLARVIGIIGPIEQEMLAKGRDVYKYFTKNHMLYERNQETNGLEYLIPKKSSLRHRLPMGDQGFIDFVGHLLEINPKKRPSASEALKHPWLQYPYEPISS
ncbi:probable serine/threonine-protein kinase dyrk2 [Phtheirospermum japonicum]|uniref:Probable serine/threonine-protein kinase dyrk2 n=1 Tax=Phtheirospermum japonicum TaxID=374723 RepID=A0A830CVL6_9LAMI|nr:probable serine/threonine-protein kinase dyrk2 [Phtheirospermum japonicum]